MGLLSGLERLRQRGAILRLLHEKARGDHVDGFDEIEISAGLEIDREAVGQVCWRLYKSGRIKRTAIGPIWTLTEKGRRLVTEPWKLSLTFYVLKWGLGFAVTALLGAWFVSAVIG